MSSLNVLSLVIGIGAGAGIVTVIWFVFGRRRDQRSVQRQDASVIYFGRDVHDHPDEIERLPAHAERAGFQRAYEHRYDGMTDGDVPHVPEGLVARRSPR